jgi:hypothetical protein
MVEAASLSPSRASLDRQHAHAKRSGFVFATDATELQRLVERGELVEVRANGDFELHEVSFPFARPEIRTFVKRIAAEYHRICGEPMVVTSLSRPTRHQPRHASRRSVHPTGMALDVRRSWSRRCRSWMDGMLLYLEGEGVLEASLERRPLHYHIAIYPRPYAALVSRQDREVEEAKHIVVRGDTLYSIAKRYDTSVPRVIEKNRLRSSRIYPGQLLVLPSSD